MKSQADQPRRPKNPALNGLLILLRVQTFQLWELERCKNSCIYICLFKESTVSACFSRLVVHLRKEIFGRLQKLVRRSLWEGKLAGSCNHFVLQLTYLAAQSPPLSVFRYVRCLPKSPHRHDLNRRSSQTTTFYEGSRIRHYNALLNRWCAFLSLLVTTCRVGEPFVALRQPFRQPSRSLVWATNELALK